LRILHIDTGREMRGGQRQVLLLAKGLRERGHDQAILARRGSPLFEASRSAGLETLPLRPVTEASAIVHAHDARAHLLALASARLVVSRRVAFPIGPSVLSRWKYRRAARYLAVSDFVKEQLVSSGVPAEKVSVVYDGVELGARPSFGARSQLVVAPATVDPQKGAALAIESCRMAAAELLLSYDLECDLPRAGLFLYLTHSEGLGSAILLAMALGVPVVASRLGGIPEVVEHRETGILVENNAAAVADAVTRMLAEPEQAGCLAAAAYDRVAERFSAARMVARTEQVYREVLDRAA
jgi:glycosyltransferase involved in cell wall biosynthesis